MSQREQYEDLARVLSEVYVMRRCISENRGHDKELARESYESFVGNELAEALTKAVEAAIGDLEPREVEQLAELLMKRLNKAGLIGDGS